MLVRDGKELILILLLIIINNTKIWEELTVDHTVGSDCTNFNLFEIT